MPHLFGHIKPPSPYITSEIVYVNMRVDLQDIIIGISEDHQYQ